MKTRLTQTLAALALFAAAPAANAIILPTDLGDTNFDDDAFATSLAGSQCSTTCLTFGGGITVGPLSTAAIEPLLTGPDLSVGVALGEGPSDGEPDFVIPEFGLLASIANGPGADFVIWEAGFPAEGMLVSVSLGGGSFSSAIEFTTAATTTPNSESGFRTNSVHIDLSDFGIAEGSLIDQVRLQGQFTGVGGSGPDILAAAALNVGPPTQDVPAPATLLLFGLGLIGLRWIGRRRNA